MAYDTSFTLDMEAAGAAGWTGRNAGNTITTGVDAPADATPYTPGPFAAGVGHNGSKALTIHTTASDFFGITTVIYDGQAGGSTIDPENYEVEVEMFVPTSHALRYHAGIGVRWNDGEGDAPFEAFYSHNTPGQPNGFGYRNTGAGSGANAYGLFPAITANHWVRIKIAVNAAIGIVSFDAANDGTFEHVSNPVDLSGVAVGPGKIVLFGVFNDPGNAAATVDQRAYFDNLKYTPAASGVGEWMVY